MKSVKEIQDMYELNVYPKRDIVAVEGRNAIVVDENGREYIDCVSGNGVANIGHANRKVADAIYQQACRIITVPGIFYNDKRAEALEKLISIAPDNLSRAFLCSSGTEAIEAALKFARISTGKTDFLCAMKAFHGRTFGALSATAKPEYRDGFAPLLQGFQHVPFNNVEKLLEKVTDNTAGILLEVVQGEGGINIGSKEYFDNVRKLCDENRIMLIIDEVQSGFCRTGKMFAVEHFGIRPDMMCVAKAIAGGIPMGAVLCSEKVNVPVGKHGTTFGGNALACAASIAAIDFMIEEDLAKQAMEKGDYLCSKLREDNLSMVRDIRNLGLMIGIELRKKPKPYILKLMEEGVLVLPGGMTVLRILPPLTIEYELLDKVAVALKKVLNMDLDD